MERSFIWDSAPRPAQEEGNEAPGKRSDKKKGGREKEGSFKICIHVSLDMGSKPQRKALHAAFVGLPFEHQIGHHGEQGSGPEGHHLA